MVKTSPPTHLWGHLTANVARLQCAVVALPQRPAARQRGRLVRRPRRSRALCPRWRAGIVAARDHSRRGRHGLRRAVAKSRYTFTPSTLKTAHAEILAALHPSLTVAFKAQAEREAALVKEHQISTQVTINTVTVTRRAPDQITVTLDARRTVWVGGQQVGEEPLQAELTVRGAVAVSGPSSRSRRVQGDDHARAECLRAVTGSLSLSST
jgi:hypothetical protein